MRVIIELFGKVMIWQLHFGEVMEEDDSEHIGHDPHGTLAAHIEHGEQSQASYTFADPINSREFGFRPQRKLIDVQMPSDLYVRPPDGG